MTKGILGGQSLLGFAINSKNTSVRGGYNATSDEMKFRLACDNSFFWVRLQCHEASSISDADEFVFSHRGYYF